MEIQSQSDTAMEVRYTGEGSDNDDPEFHSRNRKAQKGSSVPSLSERKLTIHLFGTTAEGCAVQVNINGFEPFFYVKLPNNLREVQETFVTHLQILIHKRNDWTLKRTGSYTITYERRQVLMGYTAGREFTFAKLAVKSLQSWRALKSYFLDKENGFTFHLYRDAAPLEVFEANLDPMLRFFHLRDIKPCGWVTIEAESYDEDSKTYEVDWDEISPASGGTCAPFLHAYWDIECYSESGEFPLPKKGYDHVAKLLLEYAQSADEAADLILQSIMYPENPPTYKGSIHSPATPLSRLASSWSAAQRPSMKSISSFWRPVLPLKASSSIPIRARRLFYKATRSIWLCGILIFFLDTIHSVLMSAISGVARKS